MAMKKAMLAGVKMATVSPSMYMAVVDLATTAFMTHGDMVFIDPFGVGATLAGAGVVALDGAMALDGADTTTLGIAASMADIMVGFTDRFMADTMVMPMQPTTTVEGEIPITV